MNSTTLETNCRLSQSIIWEFQRQYYDKQGIQAWVHNVPFFISSNSVIANNYAEHTINFILDGIHSGTLDTNEPIYTIELGTGSGKFSWLFIRSLKEKLKQYSLDTIKHCHIMTDFTQNNLDFWHEHPRLKPLFHSEGLDSALFDITNPQAIKLIHSNKILDNKTLKNPPVIIGNYIFDTVPQDLFKVIDGKLHSGLVTLETPKENLLNANKEVKSLKELSLTYDFVPCSTEIYPDPQINNVLKKFEKTLKSGTIFYISPTCFNVITYLNKLSKKSACYLIGDHGKFLKPSLEEETDTHIYHHESFSIKVNFLSLLIYTDICEGTGYTPYFEHGFNTIALDFTQITKKENFFKASFQKTNHQQSTLEITEISKILKEGSFSSEFIDLYVHILKTAYWDTHIFLIICKKLFENYDKTSPEFKKILEDGLHELLKNYYRLPDNNNIPAEIGRIFHQFEEFDNAIACYEVGLQDHPEHQAVMYYNIGLCKHLQNKNDEAGSYLSKAFYLDETLKSSHEEWAKKAEIPLS